MMPQKTGLNLVDNCVLQHVMVKICETFRLLRQRVLGLALARIGKMAGVSLFREGPGG